MHTYIYKYLNKGMGGSSIVAAAALRAVSTLIGTDLTNEELIHLVSQVEQGIYMYIDMFIYICFLFYGLPLFPFPFSL
jgi:aconitase B